MEKLSDFIIKFRWHIILFFFVVSALFGSLIPLAETDPEVQDMLPEDMPSRLALSRIEEIFGGTETGLIIIQRKEVLACDTPQRIRKITRQIEGVKDVERVVSISQLRELRDVDEATLSNPIVREMIRTQLAENDLISGALVSKDFTCAAVIAELESSADEVAVARELREVVSRIPGKEKIVFGGIPFFNEQLSRDVPAEMRKFMPTALLLMMGFLYTCFRQARGVLLPFSVVVMSILVGMGCIPLFGWKIHMISVLLPVILIAIANDYGIHFMSKYQEDNLPGNRMSPADLSRSAFLSLTKPVLITGVTTIAGLLCLVTHTIVPAKQLGILASLGILFALCATLFYIPALCSVLPKARPVLTGDEKEAGLLERTLHGLAGLIVRRPGTIAWLFVAFTVGSALGIRQIVVDSNPVKYYEADSPIGVASRIINEQFGGSQVLSVVARGDMKDPDTLKKMDRLERNVGRLKEVGNTISLAKLVRQLSRAGADPGDPGYDAIPDTRAKLEDLYRLYSVFGRTGELAKLVDPSFENAQILIRINDEGNAAIKRVIKTVRKEMDDDRLFVLVGGSAMIFSELIDKVVHGQLVSLLLSLLIVSLLVAVLFRSAVAGLIAVVPLVISLALLFGVMGYAGIDLDISTAMLSSIMIGVGVDYTIHFLWRYRDERRAGAPRIEAVKTTLTTAGRGITFNALSVIVGFAVLVVSVFVPVRFFGLLIVLSISSCLLGSLVLLPSICLICNPAFLEPPASRNS